jgi:hypothetical protein
MVGLLVGVVLVIEGVAFFEGLLLLEGVEGKGAAVPAADGAGHGLNSVL